MRAAWIAGLAVGAAAVVGTAVVLTSKKSAAAAPAPAPGLTYSSPTTLPVGPYAPLGTSPTLRAGQTYLLTIDGNALGATIDANWATNLAQDAQAKGYTVLGFWLQQPPPQGWPSDDNHGSSNIARAVITVGSNDIPSTSTGSSATAWATGGATA